MAGRYYWLKLRKDFFERHDIKLLERMPHGKDYIIFYLKLLLESIDKEGELLFNNHIPYTDEMLATVTDTSFEVVQNAMKLFCDFQLIERRSDGVLYMTDTKNVIGSESASAKRMRKHRDIRTSHCDTHVTKSDTEKNIDKDKDTDIDREVDVENAPLKGLPLPPQSTGIVPLDAIYKAWQDAKMPPMSNATRESIKEYLANGMDNHCIQYAILEADRNDARSFAYINGILKRLQKNNILTQDQLERDKNRAKPTGRCEGELPPDDYFRLHNSWDEL